MENSSRRNSKITGILAVLPVDGFTGTPIIQRNFAVEAEGAGGPVRKAEGFFVFSGVLPSEYGAVEEKQQLCIRLFGKGYQEELVYVPLSFVDSKDPVLTVCMKPDRDYPFSRNTVFMEGTLGPDKCLLAALGQTGPKYRLAMDCSVGEEMIAVYQEAEKNLSGRLFYMTDEGGTQKEWIRLKAPAYMTTDGKNGPAAGRGFGGYRLAGAVTHNWKKAGTVLFPALEQRAEEKPQHYFFAFSGNKIREAGADYDIICHVENRGAIEEYQIKARAGETLVKDF